MSAGAIINESVLRALSQVGRGAIDAVLLFDESGRERERLAGPGHTLPVLLSLDAQQGVVIGLEGTSWRAHVRSFDLYGKTSHHLALLEFGEARAPEETLGPATGLVARLSELEYELSELTRELTHRYDEIDFLHKLHADFATSMGSMRKLCRMLLDRVLLRVPARAGAVLLTSGRSGRATIRAAVNLAKMSGDIFFSERTVFDKVQRDKEKKTCILNESRQIPAHVLGPLAEKDLRNLMVVPLHWKKRTLGLLLLMDRDLRSEPGFTSEDSHLAESIATPFAAILHNRRLADYRMEIRKEMQIARRLHRILMQTELPDVPGLQIGTVMRRGGKSEIGGDYFDWHQTTDRSRLRATIIDVSGHGIASSLMVVLARAIIKSEARTLSSPREILRRMNEDLYPQFSKSELFLTGFLLEIENLGPQDAARAHLRYANAGHPPPLLLRGNEPLERCESLATDGLPVGILPSYTFEEKEKILAPGDVLVLYTDGVTEARSVKKRLFGERRLAKAAYEARAGTAQEIACAIDETVSRYRDPDPEAQNDDHAIAVIKKT